MTGKRRLSVCPQCGGSRTVPKQVQRIERGPDGKRVSVTEAVQVDCPTCDGSGRVVDYG